MSLRQGVSFYNFMSYLPRFRKIRKDRGEADSSDDFVNPMLSEHRRKINEAVFCYLGARFSEAFRWVHGSIVYIRGQADDGTIFIDIGPLSERWGQRNRHHKIKPIKDL